MGTFLVMKNNIKRRIRISYLLMCLLPIVIFGIITMIGEIHSKTLQVGIIGECPAKEQDFLEQNEYIKISKADPDSVITDLLMRKYDYMLDYQGECDKGYDNIISYSDPIKYKSWKEEIAKKQMIVSPLTQQSKNTNGNKEISALMMIYMITASIYAASIIRDRKNGLIVRYQSSGGRKITYILGTAGAVWFLLLILTFLALIFLRCCESSFQISTIKLFGLGLYMSVTATIFGVVLAVIHKKELNANLTATGIVAIFSLLSGTLVAVDQMPKVLQYVSVLSPIRWMLEWFL